jgi:hypothetical protein
VSLADVARTGLLLGAFALLVRTIWREIKRAQQREHLERIRATAGLVYVDEAWPELPTTSPTKTNTGPVPGTGVATDAQGVDEYSMHPKNTER